MFRITRSAFIAAVLLCTLSGAASASFQAWDPKVFAHINYKYGPQAEARMRKLQDIVANNYDKPIQDKLSVTNYALNHLPWITDQAKYKTDDYWATPLETIATFGGDCEDIAISKLMVLRHMGVPAEHLYLAYVKIKKTGEAHMVLLYLINPRAPRSEQKTLILDNYDKQIRTAKERSDLVAIYAVNAKNDVILFSDDGQGNRSIKKEVKHAKFEKIDTIKQQISENRQFYENLNGGRAFY